MRHLDHNKCSINDDCILTASLLGRAVTSTQEMYVWSSAIQNVILSDKKIGNFYPTSLPWVTTQTCHL